VYLDHQLLHEPQVNGIMTSTLERISSLRLTQLLAALAVAALFLVGSAGMASAGENYGGGDNYGSSYPTPNPPPGTPASPNTPSSTGSGGSSILPVTGSDALGLAVIGLGVTAAGAALVIAGRRRSNDPVPA
jgi:LPXTG-motif cell wall-anchored protein